MAPSVSRKPVTSGVVCDVSLEHAADGVHKFVCFVVSARSMQTVIGQAVAGVISEKLERYLVQGGLGGTHLRQYLDAVFVIVHHL